MQPRGATELQMEMLQKHVQFEKFSGGSAPISRKGFVSQLLENASKALIFVKIF